MKHSILLLLALLFLFPADILAQDEDYTNLAGYIDYKKLVDLHLSKATTEVEITKPLLSLIADASEDEDEDSANLLKNLKLKVYKFDVTPDHIPDIRNRMNHLDKRMIKINEIDSSVFATKMNCQMFTLKCMTNVFPD